MQRSTWMMLVNMQAKKAAGVVDLLPQQHHGCGNLTTTSPILFTICPWQEGVQHLHCTVQLHWCLSSQGPCLWFCILQYQAVLTVQHCTATTEPEDNNSTCVLVAPVRKSVSTTVPRTVNLRLNKRANPSSSPLCDH